MLLVRKLLSLFIIFALIAPYLLTIPDKIVFAESGKLSRKKLVAILVDDKIYQNTELKSEMTKWASGIGARIKDADTVIYKVGTLETPKSIFEKLEKLYFEGRSSSDYESYLDGVILVGNIPLANVSIQDMTSVKESVSPYTDFENKYFYYNQEYGYFIRQTDVKTLKSEVWHGIIRPKQSEINNTDFYVQYFKKLNSYYSGEIKNQDKVLFADLKEERRGVNRSLVGQYGKMKNYDFQIVNKKYTSELLSKLLKDFWGNIKDTKDVKINRNLIRDIDNDVFSVNMIKKFLPRYTDIVKGYLEKANDLIDITGKWEVNSGDTIPMLIALKDEASRNYIGVVNEILEKEIINFVEKNLQEKIKVDSFINKAEDCSNVRGTPKDNFGSKQVKFSSFKDTGKQTVQSANIGGIATYKLCSEPDGAYNIISSIVVHNQPTTEILNFITNSPQATLIPVDGRHYVSFKGKKGDVILYLPNLFNADSLVSYLQKYSNYFKNAAGNGEVLSVPDFNGIIASTAKNVDEYLKWRNFNLDEKHREILLEYGFGKEVSNYQGKNIEPYKFFYLRGENFSDDTISFNSYGGFDDSLKEEMAFTGTSKGQKDIKVKIEEKCGSINGVSIFEWFDAIKCWLKNLQIFTFETCGPGGDMDFEKFKKDFVGKIDKFGDDIKKTLNIENERNIKALERNTKSENEKNESYIDTFPRKIVSVKGKEESIAFKIVNKKGDKSENFYEVNVSASTGIRILNPDVNSEKPGMQIAFYGEQGTLKIIGDDYLNGNIIFSLDSGHLVSTSVQIIEKIFLEVKKLDGKKFPDNQYNAMFFEIESINDKGEHVDYNGPVYLSPAKQTILLNDNILYLENGKGESFLVTKAKNAAFLVSANYFESKNVDVEFDKEIISEQKADESISNNYSSILANEIKSSNFISAYLVGNNYGGQEKGIAYDFLSKGNAITIATNLDANIYDVNFELRKDAGYTINNGEYGIGLMANSGYEFYLYDTNNLDEIGNWKILSRDIKIFPVEGKKININQIGDKKFIYKDGVLLAGFGSGSYSVFSAELEGNFSTITGGVQIDFSLNKNDLFYVQLRDNSIKNISKRFKYSSGFYEISGNLSTNINKKGTESDYFGNGFSGEEKAVLKISGNQSFGESLRYENGIFSVIIGDPTLKLGKNEDLSGYDETIGEEVFSGDANVLEVHQIDYNKDGRLDVVYYDESGKLNLLERLHDSSFIDRGALAYFFDFVNSVLVTDFDFDNDSDILVALEDGRIKFLQNRNGKFLNEDLFLDFNAKSVRYMNAADLDRDGKQDIVLSNSKSQILIFYGGDKGKYKIIYSPGNNESEERLEFTVDKDTYFPEIILDSKSEKLVPIGNGRAGYDLIPIISDSNENQTPSSQYGIDDLKNLNKGALGLGDESKFDDDMSLEDKLNSKIGEINKKLSKLINEISNLTCRKGGCMHSPLNYAFLTPGRTSIPAKLGEAVGIPVGPVAGSPVFGAGLYPCPIGTCPLPCTGPLCYSSIQGLYRYYISPTLTAGLGFSYCIGDNKDPTGQLSSSQCFATTLPVEKMVCKNADKKKSNLSQKINDIVNKFNIKNHKGFSNFVSNRSNSDVNQAYGVGIEGFTPKIYTPDSNKTVQGFSKTFLSDWADKQIEEAGNKLFSFNPIQLILPDISGSFKAAKDTLGTVDLSGKFSKDNTFKPYKDNSSYNSDSKSFLISEDQKNKVRDVGLEMDRTKSKIVNPSRFIETGLDNMFSEIEKIPFITLKREKITFNIPWINFTRLFSSILAIDSWLADAKSEIERKVLALKGLKNCASFAVYEVKDYQKNKSNYGACREAKDIVDAQELISSIERELKTLKSYLEFPAKLAKYRYGLSMYLDQIISIIDCITEVLGGWFKRNKIIASKYIELAKTVQKIVELLKNFTLIYEDYKTSCEPCKANTYLSNFSFANIFFGLIPAPPIIKFPSWPTIVFDLSDIQAGIQVPVPDINFRVKEIIFDLNLPPLTIGNLVLPKLPHFPPLPDLPDLPSLPSIKVPKLADLPPPPKLPDAPGFFVDITESIRLMLKLYCLIFEKGLFVYKEGMLKELIEGMTSRSSSIMLPEDFNFLQLPNISYSSLKEIGVKTHVDIKIEPAQNVYKVLQDAAKKWNSIDTNLKKKLYEFNFGAGGQIEKVQDSINEGQRKLQNKITPGKQSFRETKLDNLMQIRNELVSYKKKINSDNIFAFENENKKEEYLSANIKESSIEQTGKVEFLSDSAKEVNIKSLDTQISSYNGNRIPRVLELSDGEGFIYAIGRSIYFKEFYGISKDTPKSDVKIEDFSGIKVNRMGINLFKTYTSNGELYLKWKNESDVSSYIIEIIDRINGFDYSKRDSNSYLIYLIYKGDLPQELLSKLKARKNSLVIPLQYNSPELKVSLNKDWYFTRITPVLSDLKYGTISNQSLLSSKDVSHLKVVRSDKLEKRSIPVLIDNKISIGSKDESVSWDLNGDGQFDEVGNEIMIRSRQRIESFKVQAYITNFFKGITTIQDVQIETFAPEILLNPQYQDIVSGEIKPLIANYPISFLIDYGNYTDLLGETFYTDNNGKFSVNKNLLKNYKRIYDSKGNTVAKLDLGDKKIITESGYALNFIPSENGIFSRFVINRGKEEIANIFTKTRGAEIEQIKNDINDVNVSYKIYVRDLNVNDDIITSILSGGIYDSAMLVSDKGTNLLLISKDGEIRTFNGASVKMKEGARSSFVFDLFYNGILVFDFYIGVDLNDAKRISQNNTIKKGDIAYHFEPEFLPIIAANVEKSVNTKELTISSKSEDIEQYINKGILPFGDVSNDNPQKEAIMELYRRNIITGYQDKTFRPENKISRAEFVKIVLGSIACEDCTRPSANEIKEFTVKPFPDVNIYDWFFYCISKAKKLKMVTGYLSDGLFRPEKNISRGEAVAILLRQAKIKVNTFTGAIKDVVDYHWFKDYVQTAVDIGLIVVKNGYVAPLEEITRGEFALIATRLLSIQDCQINDEDKNGVPDYKEKENGLGSNKWEVSDDNLKNIINNLNKNLGSSKYGLNNLGFNNLGFNNLGFNNLGFNNLGFNNLGFNNLGLNDFGGTGIFVPGIDLGQLPDKIWKILGESDDPEGSDLLSQLGDLISKNEGDKKSEIINNLNNIATLYGGDVKGLIRSLKNYFSGLGEDKYGFGKTASKLPGNNFSPISCVFLDDLGNLGEGGVIKTKIFGVIVSGDKSIIFSKSKDFVE